MSYFKKYLKPSKATKIATKRRDMHDVKPDVDESYLGRIETRENDDGSLTISFDDNFHRNLARGLGVKNLTESRIKKELLKALKNYGKTIKNNPKK